MLLQSMWFSVLSSQSVLPGALRCQKLLRTISHAAGELLVLPCANWQRPVAGGAQYAQECAEPDYLPQGRLPQLSQVNVGILWISNVHTWHESLCWASWSQFTRLKLENLQAKSLWSSAASSVRLWSNFICPLWRMTMKSQLCKSHNRSRQIASRHRQQETDSTDTLSSIWSDEQKPRGGQWFWWLQLSQHHHTWPTWLIRSVTCGKQWSTYWLKGLTVAGSGRLSFSQYSEPMIWLDLLSSIQMQLRQLNQLSSDLKLKLTRSVAVMSLHSSMWGLNQVSSLQMFLKGPVLLQS